MNKWYVSQNLKPQGPFSNSQILEWIQKGQIRPYDLAQKSELSDWMPMRDYREFPQEMFPAFQQNKTAEQWSAVNLYIRHDGLMWDHQVSFQQIKDLWAQGRLNDQSLMWTEGMSGWAYLIDRPEMAPERKVTTSFWINNL